MSEKLPQGWVKTTLGEIRLDKSVGISQEQMRGETFELYSVPAFSEGKSEIVLGDAIGSNKVLVSLGDVLLCKINPRINRTWIVGEPHGYRQIASTEWIVFSKQEGISSDFLRYFFSQDAFRDYLATNASGVGGSLMRVRPSIVETYPFTLPSLAEQNRIVAKLNTALSGVERAEKAARRAQERLKRYRAAVLNAAVTGELTQEWRESQQKSKKTNTETGEALLHRLLAVRRAHWEEAELERLRIIGKDPKSDNWKSGYTQPVQPRIDDWLELPYDWTLASVDQLAAHEERSITDGPFGSNLKTRHYTDSGPRVVRLQNIGDAVFVDDKAHISSEHYESLKNHAVYAGDLVIRALGTPAPRACKIPESLGPAIVKADCIRFKVASEFVSPDYILWALNSTAVQTHTGRMIHGVGRPRLNLGEIKSITVPLPPFEEQIEIVREVERRLSAADRLAVVLEQHFAHAHATRQSLLREAFAGNLVPQNPNDEPASVLLERIRKEKAQKEAERKQARRQLRSKTKKRSDSMQEQPPSPESLSAAWQRIGRKADARRLFDEAGLGPEYVVQFYEALRATPEVRDAFQESAKKHRHSQQPFQLSEEKPSEPKGRFRLIELWLEDFENLKDYTVRFEPTHGLDVVLGWNGTGKSNLFEALVIIFRDLHEWLERKRWRPDQSMNGYRLSYEMDEHTVEVRWHPTSMKHPELRRGPICRSEEDKVKLESIKRDQLSLPRFVFGYYSGPTNRLAEHFLPMKQAHYERLRKAKTDDAKTLAELLEQRRFFCAETHHAKYVLLAFSYKDDPKISEFLKDRLRILGFESALFIIRKPRWAKPGTTAEDFWGATGIMRRVMERLRRHAIAPMVLKQTVNYGYRSTKEDHYYFFLPDLESLHSFAAEYQDARTFFLALESIDFSELIHDVKIQVRIKATNTEQVPITFRQLSEGEQQLLMVLGLMRFTKSLQSLVLLDEPDTHLNPHWSVHYLKDLTRVMSDIALESPEQQTSQILMATHDPLVIASLVKEQIHLLKRDTENGACKWEPASINPRGLGFTGILTSEMFGFRSDLDQETLDDLDNRVRLIAKEGTLSPQEMKELEQIDKRLVDAGFSKAFSDPYYAAFVRAWGRRHSELMAGEQFLSPEKRQEIDRIASEVLKEAIAEVEQEVAG